MINKYINTITNGDCLEVMKLIPDNSVDSIITDPPYGIGFMGKEWDTFKQNRRTKSQVVNMGAGMKMPSYKEMIAFQNWFYEVAKECLRVLKPGGHLLSFGGTRTYHRMACAIEDAGFEVRDMIEWVYGSGFPKSLNIGKAVDKLQGNEREVVGKNPNHRLAENYSGILKEMNQHTGNGDLTKGTSEWEGWGTALKPAHEPICMARKPLAEKTVAENCLKWGTGGINIDESRVEAIDQKELEKNWTERKADAGFNGDKTGIYGSGKCKGENVKDYTPQGRFPANLIHDNSEEVRACFPDESERFFKSIIYTAKASKSERNKGCEGLEMKPAFDNPNGNMGGNMGSKSGPRQNNHPTVKPIALMEYLINMVTRKGGIVLDPFMGSGTTGVACVITNRKYILIEKEKDYCNIGNKRISEYRKQLKLEL